MATPGPSEERGREESPRPEARRTARPHLPNLPLGVRVVLFVIGWTLVAIGVAGLALPGIQGILTLLAGAAVLSLVSQTAHRALEKTLGRWPRVWTRIDAFRRRIHDRLHRGRGGDGESP